MNVILYRIPHLQYGKNNTINFSNDIQRDAYFNSISDKIKLSEKLSPNWIKNIWKLNNDVTIYDEGRYPYSLYNYMMIDNGDRKYYFYITDYEELGNNQVKYHLVMDTLITYVTTPSQGVDIEAKDALILREHKNRFINGKPQIHKEIEEVDLIPSVVSKVDSIEKEPVTLVLKKFGGNVFKEKILSKVKYMWELFGAGSKTFEVPAYKEIIIPEGWGIRGSDNVLKYINSKGELQEIYLDTSSSIVRHVIDSDNIHYLEALGALSESNTQIYGNSLSYSNGLIKMADFTNQTNLIFEANDSINYEVYTDLGMFKGEDVSILLESNVVGITVSSNDNEKTAKSRDVSEINKTSAINQKIIELPYTPNHDYLIRSGGNGVFIEANDLLRFDRFILDLDSYNFDTSKVDKLRVKYNDPKLYHSQFNPYFLTWFGEALDIRRESINPDIDYVEMKSTLNKSDYSKVLLMHNDENEYEENKPYENTLIIEMNNTIATMSDDFNDYVDNFYKNDMKILEMQNKKANRDNAQSAVNVLTSAAGGAVTGAILSANPVGAAVGAGVGLVKGVTNLGFQIANQNAAKQERFLKQQNKANQLKLSLINITGGNVELMNESKADELTLHKVALNSTERDYLDKYFHLYGYQTLELKKPKLRTRKYFDYKQMLIDELEEYAPVTEEVKMDIIDRFEKGVTIYHVGYTSFSNSFTLDDPDEWRHSGSDAFENNFDNIHWVNINWDIDHYDAVDWYKDGDDYVIDLGFTELILKSNGEYESSDPTWNNFNNYEVLFGYEELVGPDFKQEKENWEVD